MTATLPLDIYNKLVQIFPDCEVIMGPGMHRTSPGLEEVVVFSYPYTNNRQDNFQNMEHNFYMLHLSIIFRFLLIAVEMMVLKEQLNLRLRTKDLHWLGL